MALLFDDLVKGQTAAPPQYDQQGMYIPPTAKKPTTGTLPPLGPAGTPSPTGGNNPMEVFSSNIFQLLQRAQGANSGNATLLGQRENLENKQINNSMKPAGELGLGGLAPGDALAARGNEAGLYNPEIKSLNSRMQLNNEAVDRFTQTIKAAKDYGEEIQKYIKPSAETVEAVRTQIRNGILPDKDVLAKIQTSLTEEDWSAFTQAKNPAASEKDIVADLAGKYVDAGITLNDSLSAAQGKIAKSKIYQDQVRPPSSGGGGGGTTATERKDALVRDALQKAQQAFSARENFVGPQKNNTDFFVRIRNDYGDLVGNTTAFDSRFSVYLSPQDRARLGIGKAVGTDATPDSEDDNPFIRR